MAEPTFLGMPVEVRLVIYDMYLMKHQRVRQKCQPANDHLKLLRTCRQIYEEARPIFWRYVSLRNELEINAFILNASDAMAARILWADVANDGRVFKPLERISKQEVIPSPLSNLHLALRRMPSLQRLRVSRCNFCCPGSGSGAPRLALEFEFAMYPSATAPRLSAYEIFMDAESRVQPFQVISPRSVEKLRLSGEVRLPPSVEAPALRQVTLHSITGNHFDRNNIESSFPGACLESFLYAQGHRLGFELRNRHLESVVALSGSRLRTLVLLGCSRLSSACIASCLEQLPLLEIFALSLVTVDELRTNFLLSLPLTVSVLKVHVVNAWYAVPLRVEERGLLDALENSIMVREKPPKRTTLNFREQLLLEDGRKERLMELAQLHDIDLCIKPWENDCEHAI
ncbi:uncharacterized protein B0H18DRAFT_867218 [Fomitopsis serialis]|uniref:uncharacterized protein n=1 Tax=Fomitopsis serialis TaxID=139415 RepID=UPI0020085D61|nr:uncharacterized protein B0H18DRAFT_867218 [Neoantrodia serialis]KAH9937096.1 hypothetical protein B0H18DRAFT_867218 [Neoantrodia serialis]